MIEYRKVTIDEADLLAGVRVDFLVEANNITGENEKAIMLKNNTQFLSRSLADGSFVSWIAIEFDKIVATSGVSFYTLPPNKSSPDGRVAYISNMFTYPKYRNRGIASKLFALTVEEAKQHGCIKILLNATEMGRPIYKEFGFKDTEDDMVYYV